MDASTNNLTFQYDIKQKKIVCMNFLNENYTILLDIKFPEDLINTLDFLLDYQQKTEATKPELKRLTQHMFNKLRYFNMQETLAEMVENNEQPVTLRQITYDKIKEVLEDRLETNLDEMTELILKTKYPIELKRDSVRASISAVFSALRSCFKDLGVEAWELSVWRGKTTGRNPHIKVPKKFIMPAYYLLWERYGQQNKKR